MKTSRHRYNMHKVRITAFTYDNLCYNEMLHFEKQNVKQ